MTKREKERLNRYLDRIVEGFEEFQEDLTDDTKFWNAYRSIKKMAGEEKVSNEKGPSSDRLREIVCHMIDSVQERIDFLYSDEDAYVSHLASFIEDTGITREDAIELRMPETFGAKRLNMAFAEFE